MDNLPLTVGVDDFFDGAEDITDISIPSGAEELVRTFSRQFEMTLGLPRGISSPKAPWA